MASNPPITEVLARAQPGPELSAAALLPVVYDELRALAGSYLRQSQQHTLQPTALVHEAYVKLIGSDRAWSGRDHFMAVAARAMRQVLVDYARAKHTIKRGGGVQKSGVSISMIGDDARPGGAGAAEAANADDGFQVLELHHLLETLTKLSDRPARVAEMRLFGGMTTAQIAAVLGVSDFTVKQDWQFARAWLAGKMRESGQHGG